MFKNLINKFIEIIILLCLLILCNIGPCNEPPLPRRKKCPELAYKTHEFINCDQPTSIPFRNDNSLANRARVSEVFLYFYI